MSMAVFCLLCVLTGIAAGSGVLIICGLALLSVALWLFRRARRAAA
jgi:LPXTG-motif cell wall-anchored protein